MALYRIQFVPTALSYYDIEADSEYEAITEFYDRTAFDGAFAEEMADTYIDYMKKDLKRMGLPFRVVGTKEH